MTGKISEDDIPTSGADLWLAAQQPGANRRVPVDTDGTLAANSDTKIASQKATKTAVDAATAFLQSGTGAVGQTVQNKLKEVKSVLDFGAVGDCTAVSAGTDDAVAIQKALNWLVGANNRGIVFPSGYRWRISSTCTADFAGKFGGSLVMLSPLTPDPGIGNGIEIINTSSSTFRMFVYEGGQDADYTQANPTGADQAIYIRGCRDIYVSVLGSQFAGRLCRCTTEHAGENKTSNIHFDSFVNESVNTGQSLYVDCSTSWGHILDMRDYNCKYGSIFKGTDDISIGLYEGSVANGHGLVFDSCISVWIVSISIGSNSSPVDTDLVTFVNSSNAHIGSLFADNGTKGVKVTNAGWSSPTFGQASSGITIDGLYTIGCTLGAEYIDCNGVKVHHQSGGDGQAFTFSGTHGQNSELSVHIGYDTGIGGLIDTGVAGLVVSGYANNTNTAGAVLTPVFKVNTAGRVIFRDMQVAGSAANFLYDLPATNDVRILGGSVSIGGSTTVFNSTNLPKRMNDVDGFKTVNRGSAGITAGLTAVTVNHGLGGAPAFTGATMRTVDAAIQAASTNTRTATQFNMQINAASAQALQFDWWAAMACADG